MLDGKMSSVLFWLALFVRLNVPNRNWIPDLEFVYSSNSAVADSI